MKKQLRVGILDHLCRTPPHDDLALGEDAAGAGTGADGDADKVRPIGVIAQDNR